MNKLYAFGCSYTYGNETSDWYHDESIPSKQAWPSLLAARLNLECVNLSKSGASNDRIFKTILTTIKSITQDDMIGVMMTFPNRRLSIKGDLHLSTHTDYFLKYHSDELGSLNFIQNLYSIKHLLEQEGVPHFITLTDNRTFLETKKHFPQYKISSKDIIMGPGLGFFKDVGNLRHPNDSGHIKICDYLFDSLN